MTRKNALAFSLMMRKLQLISGVVIALAVAAPAYANESNAYKVQGQKGEGDTCHFSTSLTLKPEEKFVEARQTSFDAETCTLTMQRTTKLTQEDSKGLVTKSGTSEESSRPAASSLINSQAIFSARAYSRTIVENRFDSFQHHVKDGVSFLYDGFNVSGGCLIYGDTYRWNSLWRLLSTSTQTCRYNSSESTITASSFGSYRSPAFYYCSVGTNVYYNRHRTVGYASGAIRDFTSFGGSSGCISQLFYRSQVVRY